MKGHFEYNTSRRFSLRYIRNAYINLTILLSKGIEKEIS